MIQEHGVVCDTGNAYSFYVKAVDSCGIEGSLGRGAEGGVPVFRVLLHPAWLGKPVRVFRLGCAEDRQCSFMTMVLQLLDPKSEARKYGMKILPRDCCLKRTRYFANVSLGK